MTKIILLSVICVFLNSCMSNNEPLPELKSPCVAGPSNEAGDPCQKRAVNLLKDFV